MTPGISITAREDEDGPYRIVGPFNGRFAISGPTLDDTGFHPTFKLHKALELVNVLNRSHAEMERMERFPTQAKGPGA